MQMPLMKEVLGAMNIPIYECEGWEADDILGTVGEICTREGDDCVIVTGDRDSLQLVSEHVTVKLVTSKAGQTITTNYTPDVFRAEYGFEPVRLVDLKSLMGDSSDNIPGVSGVGPKTATQLLLSYGTLDGIFEHLPSFAPGIKVKLVRPVPYAVLPAPQPERCRIDRSVVARNDPLLIASCGRRADKRRVKEVIHPTLRLTPLPQNEPPVKNARVKPFIASAYGFAQRRIVLHRKLQMQAIALFRLQNPFLIEPVLRTLRVAAEPQPAALHRASGACLLDK